MCVCVCVCVGLSIKSHLTSGASVRRENAATYSAGNEGQIICGVFSEILPLRTSYLDGHNNYSTENTHAYAPYGVLPWYYIAYSAA